MVQLPPPIDMPHANNGNFLLAGSIGEMGKREMRDEQGRILGATPLHTLSDVGPPQLPTHEEASKKQTSMTKSQSHCSSFDRYQISYKLNKQISPLNHNYYSIITIKQC